MLWLIFNKWKIGYILGVFGVLSFELVLLMIKYQEFILVFYLGVFVINWLIWYVMVNVLGFGGNVISVILEAV